VRRPNRNNRRFEPSDPPLPTWWLVFSRESNELWMGGKALTLLLIYTVLLGVYSYLMASNNLVSLMPPNEMVYELMNASIGVGLFIGLIIGAGSLSGDRERATLEGLLLTPASRRQIMVGKFLAALSPWPVALGITVPYAKLLSHGDEVFGPAVLLCALLGSLLAAGFTGLGMLVSFWCSTNKSSMFVSLTFYTLLLLPAQLPGGSRLYLGALDVSRLNPIESTTWILTKMLMDSRPFGEVRGWLAAPVVFVLLIAGLLFLYAGPGLRLEPGTFDGSHLGRLLGLWGRLVPWRRTPRLES